jgi:hypothetical protein
VPATHGVGDEGVGPHTVFEVALQVEITTLFTPEHVEQGVQGEEPEEE